MPSLLQVMRHLGCLLVASLVINGWLAAAAVAAPQYIQGNYETPQTPQASVTVTYSGAQSAGNLNVVAVGWSDGTTTVQNISDLRGNVYKLAAGPTVIPGVKTQAIYYASNISPSAAGTNKVTVTFGAAVVYPDIRI